MIEKNFENILRLGHSIHEEKVTSALLLSKLGSYARNNSLANALREMGKIEKTIFILEYASNSTTSAVGKLIFNIFSALAQFERDIISERTMAGLQSARIRGRKGGRPRITDNKMMVALKMYQSNDYPISQILDTVGISKTTLYKYLNNSKLETKKI